MLVSCVLDDKAHVMELGKLDTGNDIGRSRYRYGITDVVAERASALYVVERTARCILKIRVLNLSRKLLTVSS